MFKVNNFLTIGLVLALLLMLAICVFACAPETSQSPPPVSSTPPSLSPLPPPPTPVEKPKVVRIEESSPAFVYTPGWKSEQNEGASGGSWTMTHLGAYGYDSQKVDVKFKGTGVSLVYLVGSFGGIADIKIDEKDYPSIDMYAPANALKVTSIATDLTNTDHILTISPSKDSNPSVSLPSGGPTKPVICVDAIDVIVP